MQRIVSYYKGKDIFWLRIFGFGFCIKKGFSFSQRNGYSKFIKIGEWALTFLNKKL